MGLFDNFFGGHDLRLQDEAKESSKVDEIVETASRLGLSVTKEEAVQFLTGRFTGITPEQQDKWYRLKTERNELIKQLKIDSFKELPASIRQYIIDSITWTRSITAINEARLDPTPEEIYFEQLAERYSMLRDVVTGNSGHHSWGARSRDKGPDFGVFTVEGGSQYATIHLNEDMITLKQLVDAHAEQCIADGITGDLNK